MTLSDIEKKPLSSGDIETGIIDYSSLLTMLTNRHSIRKFTPEPIPDDYIEKILEVGRWAPSCKNSQPWEFVVIKNKGTRADIVRLLDGDYEKQRKQAPAGPSLAQLFIIVCSDVNNKPPASLGRRSDSMFYSSLGNSIIYMALAATTVGLGAQWVSAIAVPGVEAGVKKLLGLPDDWQIFDMLALGFPDGEANPRTVREMSDIVHYDRYYE
jgi:nitroreductase